MKPIEKYDSARAVTDWDEGSKTNERGQNRRYNYNHVITKSLNRAVFSSLCMLMPANCHELKTQYVRNFNHYLHLCRWKRLL